MKTVKEIYDYFHQFLNADKKSASLMEFLETIPNFLEPMKKYVVFDSECIGQMLSHQALFIGYIDTDESKPMEERDQSSMHLLYKFKEQYAQYIFPIIRKAMNRYQL